MGNMLFWLSLVYLLTQIFITPSIALPAGFVDEGLSSINGPMSGTFAPNPRNQGKPMLLIATESNVIYAMEDPDGANTFDSEIVVADLISVTCTDGPRGLFSMMVHPNFASNLYVYIFYTRLLGNCDEDAVTGPSNRLSRFKMDPETLKLDLTSEFVLLETPPTLRALHDGGAMSFGNDGLIYLVTGDSSRPNLPSDLKHLFGKLIRVDENGNVPPDNPYTANSGGNGVPCGKNRGTLPKNSPTDAVCSEIYAYGFRNPFRMSQDINEKEKVRFVIGDVGEAIWEEISEGGTDFKGKNYGWGTIEGPCQRNSFTECPLPGPGVVDPFYYYQHLTGEAVVGSVFVPDGLWSDEYKFLFIEYVHGTMFNLIEDASAGCRKCEPPTPAYRNETFHKFGRMVDVFFAPYKDTQAMYYLSREGGLNIRRIRYVNNDNKVPKAQITLSATNYQINEVIDFVGSGSSDPDGDPLTYSWSFGDGRTSTQDDPAIKYSTVGQYTVQLKVTDPDGAISQASKTITVGTKPQAWILSPASGEKFAVGQVLRLKGKATDSQNRPIPDSQIFWEVQQKHGNHFHPFLDYIAGNNIDLQPAPPPEDFLAADNSYLKIYMHVVDSDGVTTTKQRNVYPKKVSIDIDSKTRRGLKVVTDGFTVITPATITSWENHSMTLSVSDQGNFVFSSWNIGGGRETKFLVPKAAEKNPRIIANLIKVGLR